MNFAYIYRQDELMGCFQRLLVSGKQWSLHRGVLAATPDNPLTQGDSRASVPFTVVGEVDGQVRTLADCRVTQVLGWPDCPGLIARIQGVVL